MSTHLHHFSEGVIIISSFVIVADGKTKDIPQDETFLNEDGLEKPCCEIRLERGGFLYF